MAGRHDIKSRPTRRLEKRRRRQGGTPGRRGRGEDGAPAPVHGRRRLVPLEQTVRRLRAELRQPAAYEPVGVRKKTRQLRGVRPGGRGCRADDGGLAEPAEHGVDKSRLRRTEQGLGLIDRMMHDPGRLPLVAGGHAGLEQLKAGHEQHRPQSRPRRPLHQGRDGRVDPSIVPQRAEQHMLAAGPFLAGPRVRRPPPRAFQQGIHPFAPLQPAFQQRDRDRPGASERLVRQGLHPGNVKIHSLTFHPILHSTHRSRHAKPPL